eukprot:TRINITY_DN23082_c0_g1_i1.p1 TRINITY_DN23082_c0_g1~~TRINITY_DN23082_c0_g1_i1.p1  ORF type:complete len:190 (-),score=4.66 TRINITY_DN23082_c0_g1_i1:46-615(-)
MTAQDACVHEAAPSRSLVVLQCCNGIPRRTKRKLADIYALWTQNDTSKTQAPNSVKGISCCASPSNRRLQLPKRDLACQAQSRGCSRTSNISASGESFAGATDFLQAHWTLGGADTMMLSIRFVTIQPELYTPIVEQVELYIPATAQFLPLAVACVECERAPPSSEGQPRSKNVGPYVPRERLCLEGEA